ncbi:MAG: sensor histidine kinase [Actinomycetota bacterium]
MRPRTSFRLAWSLCVLAGALTAGAALLALGHETTFSGFGGAGLLAVLPFPIVGAILASRRPGNAISWIFLGIGLSFAVASLSGEYARQALIVDPGSLPGGAFMSWVSVWTWPPGITLLMVFLLLLFPDGRLPSRRWRPVAWLGAVALVFQMVPIAVTAWSVRGPLLTRLGEDPPPGAPESFQLGFYLQVLGVLLMFALGLLSAISLVLRFRRATGDERAQVKWFASAGSLLVIATILNSPLFHVGGGWLPVLAFLLLPVATGVAILKYRLYDLDIVIKKTVVFGLLAGFITLVYLAVVVGLPTLVLGIGTGKSSGFSLLYLGATLIIALAFQPMRNAARRLADRLVYGGRATPYEVLSEFSDRLAGAYSTVDVLPRLAQILAAGTGAERARVWLRVGNELRPAATWPAEAGSAPIPIEGQTLLEFPKGEHAVEVRHQGELLGALWVSMPANDPMNPAKDKLVHELAAQAGLVLRNVRLIEELQESRRRIVAAQDERAKKLERNIHDGAQQQLVALAVKLRLAEGLVGRDEERERALLAEVRAETQDALENLRDLARGIYPPLLVDKGLAEALNAQARRAPIPVAVESDGAGRFPLEVEAAAYFCALEALQNVSKYAEASRASIRLREANGHLIFTVQDDGVGFDPKATRFGSGLMNIRDRLEALGGALEISSAPGKGTTITGRIPARATEPDR